MRRERRRTNAKDHEQHHAHLADAARRGARSGGEPLQDTVRLPLESRFGHDFRNVRVHDDADAASAARELAARAYTIGEDVVFAEGSYAPETSEGARVLAHEITHVVQQSRSSLAAGEKSAQSAHVLDAGDASELSAENVAESITAGEVLPVESVGAIGDSSLIAGSAVVQRWPWDDDKPAGDAAPAATPDASSTGSSGSIWDSVTSVASSVVSGVESAGSAAYQGYEKSTDFRGLANELNKGVDWVEKGSTAGNQQMVDSAKGIPVLEQLAQGSAWVSNALTDVTGGVVKGAGDLASGLLGGLAHPIDAASGIEGILEHTGTGVPFMGTTLKGIHGLYDLAANGGGQYGNSMGDLANHLFNPLQQSEDDTNYLGALGKGIIAPGDEKEGGGWQRWKDNPLEAAARAATNIAPMVMGLGEAAAPEAAADVTATAADTADAAGSALKPPAGPPGPGAVDFEPPPSTKPYDSNFFNPSSGAKTVPGMDTIPGGYDAPHPLTPDVPPEPGSVPEPASGPEPGEGPQRGGDPADPNARKTLAPDEIPEGQMDDLLPDDVKAFKAAKQEYLAKYGNSAPLPPPEPIPEAPLPDTPVQTRNPVQQITPVDPADVYPGAPPPPGFQAGPVGSFDPASGSDYINRLINDSLRDAGPLNDGSRPLTTQGLGKNAPIIEAPPEPSGPGPDSGSGGSGSGGGSGGGGAPAAAPTSQPGWFSRLGDWVNGLFGGREPTPPPAAEGATEVDQIIKQKQAEGGPSDEDLRAAKPSYPEGGGHGARPLLGKGQNFPAESLYRRRRKW